MQKVIITGATGVIGYALIKELIERGIEVTVIVRQNSKHLSVLNDISNIKIYECDISELKTLGSILDKDYDTFFHLAWSGTYGAERNDTYIQNLNIKYTLDAVELASKIGCKTFLGAGSQAEYGPTNQVLNEKTPVNPDTGYGIAKYSAGRLSKILCEQHEIKQVWCRVLSVYGPNDNNSLIASTINKFLNNESMEFTKGEQVWDYLYSRDCARAMILSAEKAKHGSIYCLGSGQTRLLREYIEIIRKKINPNMNIEYGKRPYNENQVMFLKADISSLINDIGFMPEYSFEEGISETIDWYKKKLR